MLSINSRNIITPCTSQCDLDDNNICTGCYRSSFEISDWMNKSEDEKIEIVIRCKKMIQAQLESDHT